MAELMNPVGNTFVCNARLTRDAEVKTRGDQKIVAIGLVNKPTFKKDAPALFMNADQFGEKAVELFGGLKKGDVVSVSGNLVPREYNGKTYWDLKNASITRLSKPQEDGEGSTRDQGIGTSPAGRNSAPAADYDPMADI